MLLWVAVEDLGGGSFRMPAALCGIIGFKPTFGRVPHKGVLPFNWTVGMVEILSGTVEDSLITYAAISGQLLSDQYTVLEDGFKDDSMRIMNYIKRGSPKCQVLCYGDEAWIEDFRC